jgi:hypothetical protein
MRTQDVVLKGLVDHDRVPSQIVLPAGEYGFVHFTCGRYRSSQTYRARFAQQPRTSVDGSGSLYDRPIVAFKVEPGEVVDIGSVRLSTTRVGGIGLFGPTGNFAAGVTPIPEPWLRALAASKPNLFDARIIRPMYVPAPKAQEQS